MVEKKANLLFLDTETTGAEVGHDRLCSVAYGNSADTIAHELFKPPLTISVDAQATHHITNEMVVDKDPFAGSKMYQELEELLTGNILVAHNARFDIGMLEIEGLKVGEFIDTVKIARSLDEQAQIPRYGLQYLRYYLKLDVDDAAAHSADGDVKVLISLFNRLREKMSLEKMLTVSKEPSLLKRIPFGKYRGELLEDIARKDAGYLQWLLDEKKKEENTANDDEDLVFSLKTTLNTS